MAILVKKSLKYERTDTYIDQAGRILLIEINLTRFLSSAIVHSQRTKQLSLPLFLTVVNFSKHELVLGGGWNLVLDNKLDKDGAQFTQTNYSKKK